MPIRDTARPAAVPRVALVVQLPGDVLDASPDPAGKVIYFTSSGRSGPGIYRVPLRGGLRQPVLLGRPLRAPAGIAVSDDGRRLFVADRAAGHVLVVPVGGGRPHVLRGSAGTAPRGLEIQTRAGREHVVYSGRIRGLPALLRLRAAGAGRPTVLLAGTPLRAPDGVAISRGGAIYVTDHGPGGGRALRIGGDTVTTVAAGLRLGNPAGIALTLDESSVLVSPPACASATPRESR
jgi:sugar lactone lactonase YvrE